MTGDQDHSGGARLMTRRAVMLSLLGAAAGAAAASPVAEAYTFGVTHHTRELPGLTRPLRVTQLSDLHYGPFVRARSVRTWVDAAQRTHADVILITGDFVDHRLDTTARDLITELRALHAPLGVYGVWGNHDYEYFGANDSPYRHWTARRLAFHDALADAGIQMLRNRGVPLRSDVYLAGVDDFRCGAPDLTRALRDAPGSGATLLMSHNPDFLPLVSEQVQFTFSGHTHGGQIRLPLIGALSTSSQYGQRFASGFIQDRTPGFVSRGLGVSHLPLRVNCPPELAVLDLHPPT